MVFAPDVLHLPLGPYEMIMAPKGFLWLLLFRAIRSCGACFQPKRDLELSEASVSDQTTSTETFEVAAVFFGGNITTSTTATRTQGVPLALPSECSPY